LSGAEEPEVPVIEGVKEVIMRREKDGQWLRFERPLETLQASKPDDVNAILDYIERQVNSKNLFGAGFLSYEAGAAFDPAFQFRRIKCDRYNFPLIWFGLFEKADFFDVPTVERNPGIIPEWRSSVTENEYKSAILSIKRYIKAGATYQVNYSFRLHAPFKGNAREMFFKLVAGRNITCAAFIETEQFAVCSLSPELFFSLNGRIISSRPMKGTLPRGFLQSDDEMMACRLFNSRKDRAENVMIVDMVRNDLGRIAVPGTVHASSMFDVEKHDTVWQMTSTVRAQTHASLRQIFQALFPPASVTGAPKVNTMRIIARLEKGPRRIYTASIGYLMPRRRAQFNVAIRTMLIDKLPCRAEYGVGGGIVWDSTAESEYKECFSKARILQAPSNEFSLLETILWTPREGFFLLDLHLARLKSSAAYFSFPCHEKTLRNKLFSLADTFLRQAYRVRLLLARNGQISCEAGLFKQEERSNSPRVCLAEFPIDPDDRFLYHKTTNRHVYEKAMSLRPGYDDVILWNKKKEVTEFCSANIVVNLKGKLLTPPVACGLLPGTFRAWLLREGLVKEQVIKISLLSKCSEIYLCNSVRKMQEVKLVIRN
jgi:para-aminobenzoate synthetase/4-amino-4-deoxychorismate lyase